jgi:TolB-like protein/DNA-binding winged helix-turn-helix (wHTH) protein
MDVSLRERGIFVFGPFRLDPLRRILRRNDSEVTLTARLFDTLLYLVQNPERLVTRDELESAVWGGRVVEEGNLQKAISALRKALHTEAGADTIIITVPGRGFRFALPVAFEPEDIPAAGQGAIAAASNLPPLATARPARLWRALTALGVAAVAVAMVGDAVWHFAGRPQRFAPPPHSIAIMAFTNMSGDPAQDYMADGISEELIDALDRVGRLRVAARLSSFAYKGRPISVSDIARQLNVGAVLEGSVRRDGGQVRIITQLIDATTGFQLWSRRYDRAWGDVLTVQEDIAQAVASALKVSLLGDDVAKLNLGGTPNPKAMDAYLRGMHLFEGLDRRDLPRALAAFDEAIAADPDFALAWCGRSYAQSDIEYDMGNPNAAAARDMRNGARASANRAIALAPRLADAHVALAGVLSANFIDPADAVVELRQAVALEPGNQSGQANLAEALMNTGAVAEGVAIAKRLAEADPLLPWGWEVYAYVLLNAHRYEDAMDALGHEKALSGTLPPMAAWVLVQVELLGGDVKAAAANCEAGSKGIRQNICLAIAYHALGRQHEALAQLAAVQSAANYSSYSAATIFAQWGETDRALNALQAAYAARDPKLEELRADPLLDPIRATPEFNDIERRLHLSP